MDIAKCVEDSITYYAIDFSQLPPPDLERKRRLLQCVECGKPAFFRKASRSGKAACFGGRPHADNCSLAASDYSQFDNETDEEQNILHNAGNRIIVDLNFGKSLSVPTNNIETTPNIRPTGRYTGNGYRPDARMHRRLSTLLYNLIEVPEFRNSIQILQIDNHPDSHVKDFFVNLLAIEYQHIDSFRGFWGLLSDARFGNGGTLWLNSGGRDNISFCLPQELIDSIYQRYFINEIEDFAGAYILVLGYLRISQNGKLYCKIDGTEYVALRLQR